DGSKINRFDNTCKFIRKKIKSFCIEGIFAFTISMVPYAIASTFLTKCKVIGAERANPKNFGMKARLIKNTIACLCDGYVFQTKGACNCYPVLIRKKSVVIGNIAPGKHDDQQRTKHDKWICTAGRLHEDKDFITLIKAMKVVLERVPEAELNIYGDGPLRGDLEKLVQDLGIDKNVHFRGFIKDLTEEMQKNSVFVFSSRSEGMPNALIEAMSLGLPCVSTDCEFGPSDLIRDGINGFLVPIGDSQKIAEQVTKLLMDDLLRIKIGLQAKEILITNSEEIIATKYFDYFSDIVG
ncbi:MAG: glycosyltransferase family 4 protein, partial [Erysipelotrichaceae bacterium]|nr:glycosyltransferase family 4 protein [Erysipelotrichaceae bacterium]